MADKTNDAASAADEAPKKAAPKKAAPKKAPAAESTKAAPKKESTAKAAPKKAAASTSAAKAEPTKESAAKKDSAAAKAAPKKESAATGAKAAGSTKAVPKKAAPKKAAASAEAEAGNGGALKLHHLRPAPGAHTRKTRVGRGDASKGKTAGRGTKGTKARNQVPARLEGGQMPLHMRLPKLRGFKNPARVQYQVVNLDALGHLYPDGGSVTSADLVAKGAVRKGKPVKVLGNGDIGVKLEVAVEAVSSSAREKIVAAGGSVQD